MYISLLLANLVKVNELGGILAYLDPGTGSLIFQAILGALLGGLMALKLFWSRIRLALRRIFSRNKVDEVKSD